MNALELLKKDHDTVEELFEKVKATENEQAHEQLFEKIKMELLTHTHIEETIFYPAVMKSEELKDMVMEGLEEHKQAKVLIRDIPKLSEGSDKFEAKLKVLMEDVEHHVKEEEDEMFPLVKDAFDKAQLEELGEQLEAEKQNFKKSYQASAGK